jgi:hypothetical protein
MNLQEVRASKINQLHQEIVTMLMEQSFDKNLTVFDDLHHPLQIFLTNSGLDCELYNSDPNYRAIVNSLDHDRLQLVEKMLAIANMVLVMGDPRLDKSDRYMFVPYNDDEGPSGPWVHQVDDTLWRAEQAEAWLYPVCLDYFQQRNTETTRLIFVSAYPDPPYHRVHKLKELPEGLVTPLQTPKQIETIEMPRRSRSFDPQHPKWPSGVTWLPGKLAHVEYEVPIEVYGVGVAAKQHIERINPRYSIRDLWMIENCADIAIAFHDGESSSTHWNYEAATKRDVPSILVTFDKPTDMDSRRLAWKRVEQK